MAAESCPVCGLLIGDPQRHAAYHLREGARHEEMHEAARRELWQRQTAEPETLVRPDWDAPAAPE